jgi:hypothetical protein
MTNVFRTMAGNARGFILFAWPLGLLLMALSVVLMAEDYATSKAGYEMLPTAKVNTGLVTFTVAALPQLAQIVLFFIFGRDTKKGWAVLLASVFFLADLGTDSWYKAGGSWSMMPLAILESLFIFTLGSEVLFSIAAGFVAETFADFVVAFAFFLKSAMDAVGHLGKALGLSDDEPQQPRNSGNPGDQRRPQ